MVESFGSELQFCWQRQRMDHEPEGVLDSRDQTESRRDCDWEHASCLLIYVGGADTRC